MLLHNAWPRLWAEVNARAVAEAGRTGDALFFMRSGFAACSDTVRCCGAVTSRSISPRHDGLPSAICAALSSGLVGNPYHHSDIGGYMSLYGNRRTPELLMRWAEMAAFTAVMRTHEGNRPGENLQIDSSPALLAHFARMTGVFRTLAPYRRALVVTEAAARGLPMQRALFQEFPGRCRRIRCRMRTCSGLICSWLRCWPRARAPGGRGCRPVRDGPISGRARLRGRPGDGVGPAGASRRFSSGTDER